MKRRKPELFKVTEEKKQQLYYAEQIYTAFTTDYLKEAARCLGSRKMM